MKHLIAFLAATGLLLICQPAFAQQTSKVLSACGTATYTAGSVNYQTVDTTGASCGASTGGTPASPTSITPRNALSSDASSTVTLGGTFQTALAQNTSRLNCTIQNNDASKTEPLFVSIASSPTVANSYAVPYGATFSCTSGVIVMGDAIKVTAATTGHTFVETSQ